MVPSNSRRARLRHGAHARKAALWCTLWTLASSRCPPASAQTNQGHSSTPQAPSVIAVATPSSADVRQAVLHELGADAHLVASGIEVTVSSGIVELSGTVAALLWRARAARIATEARGVRAVVNRIRVVRVRRSDNLVARDVREALRHTAALSKLPISVRVTDGVVELDGSISTWDEQLLAERVASGVPGVRFCQNQLTWTRAIKRTSATIAADIQSRLAWDPLVEHDPIRATVREGRVILVGTTGGTAEQSRAVALAWVKGVRRVDAHALGIDASKRPDPNVRVSFPSDREIASTIMDLGDGSRAIPTSAWSVSVTAGVVTVNGTTSTLAEARAIEAWARCVVGVVDVKSELRGPWWKPPTTPTMRFPRNGGPRRR